MKEELRTLWKLQQLDIEISDLELQKENIPKEIEKSGGKVQAKEEERERKKKTFEEHTGQRRQLEQEINGAKDAVARYKSQLLGVKTNKEYQSLLHEINTQETKISAYEDEVLEHLAQGEELSKVVEKLSEELRKKREKFIKYKERMQGRLFQVESEWLKKRDEREKLASKVDKVYLSRYEQVRKSRGGIGIVEISGSVCKGCNAILPPQFIAEVKKGDRVLTCEQCGRILIWKENVD